MSKMRSDSYGEGYWERGEGSNYHNYANDPHWPDVLGVIDHFCEDQWCRLVEAACSKGWFVRTAIDFGWNASGFDISEYAITHCAPGVADFIAQHNAADPWHYSDGEADVVCGFEFLEHVPEDEVDLVLAEMRRVLVEGGLLVLKTGIVIPDDHPFAGAAGPEDNDKTHVCIHNRVWWEEKLAEHFNVHRKDVEDAFDEATKSIDWFGRWFVWSWEEEEA